MATETGKLYFWKQRSTLVGSRQLVDSLDSGELPDVMADLPLLELVKTLRAAYPSGTWSVAERAGEVDLVAQEAAFEFNWSRKHLRVLCYGDSFEEMDRLARLLAKVDLACFDAFENRQYSIESLPAFAGPDSPPTEEEMIIKMHDEFVRQDHQRLLRGVSKNEIGAILRKYEESGGRQSAYEAALKHVRAIRRQM